MLQRKLLWSIACALTLIAGPFLQAEEPPPALHPPSERVQPKADLDVPSTVLSKSQQERLSRWIDLLSKADAKRPKERIVKLGRGATSALLAALEKAKVVQAQQIAEILGDIRDPRALPALEELLRSKNKWNRCAAVFAIAKISDKEATPKLVKCLEDPNRQVCEMTIRTLASLDDSRAIPGLIKVMRNSMGGLRVQAAAALVQLSGGTIDHGTDWMSWQLWYDSEIKPLSRGDGSIGL